MNILVCCGSKQPDNLFFREASRAADLVANFITSHNHNLVFGGSKSGLMGIVYKGVEKRKNANSQIFICTLKKRSEGSTISKGRCDCGTSGRPWHCRRIQFCRGVQVGSRTQQGDYRIQLCRLF